MPLFFGTEGGRWRDWLAAFARAWLPTWRFYDSPDYWIEIRCDRDQAWRPLLRAQSFRIRYFALNPDLVDRMWCESRLRFFLDRANECGGLDTAALEDLTALSERALEAPVQLRGRRWSLRTRSALDGSISMEVHLPGPKEMHP